MAKLSTPAPDDLTWREIHKLELSTPAMGGTTTFDGNDDPTQGHMNAQAIQMISRTEMLRHRSPAEARNALLMCKLSGGVTPDFLTTAGAATFTIFADATDPLVMTFAKGYGAIGAVDYVAMVDTSEVIDISALADGIHSIFAIYDTADGTVSFDVPDYTSFVGFQVSDTAPSILGGSNVPGRYWWQPATKKAFRTEGSPGSVAWVNVCAVYIGTVETTGGTVDAVAEIQQLGPTQDVNVQIPAGTIMAYAGNGVPSAGWLNCDGSAVSRTGFPKLFAALGTTWGVGNGSTTFNIPDLRGEFIRGFDGGRGVDAGRVYASLQQDAFEDHTHTVPVLNSGTAAAGDYIASAATTNDTVTSSVASTGAGTETRPRNVAMYYIIKSN